ncbi:hypothetical protein QYF36_005641 [Acer negundo]|nr:hypothetical protein QYF36_005641 [Acer negundo]
MKVSLSNPLISLHFLFHSLLTLQFLKATSASCHVDDEAGLLGFKSGITQDPSGMLSSWKPGTDCCTWEGINCLVNNRALDTLDLSQNRFSGTVPKSFGNLTKISKIFNLDLSHNSLVDPFPVMNVEGIESLDLSYNTFHLNQIPKWVTSSSIIYSLKLAKCGLKLKLDDWKPAETYSYDYIDLSENKISGSPVPLLNRTDYLVGFWVSGNMLKFNIESLRIVKRLKNLNLSRNLVFGKLPEAVSGLDKLNVSYNHLCGKIPAAKFPATAYVGNDCLCGSPLQPCKE